MKKVLSLLLTIVMIASVCVLPVSAANIAFGVDNIVMLDAAKGTLSVSGTIVEADGTQQDTFSNRYVTIIVLPKGTALSAYDANTLAFAVAPADTTGKFEASFKFTKGTGEYDFYALYKDQAFGPAQYEFISLADAAKVIRNIANGSISKDSIVSQIQNSNNGIGLDFSKFPVGFERDLLVHRIDKSRAEITGTTDAEVLSSFSDLVAKAENEIAFVKEFNAVTYSGDYLALLQANVKHTGIDFAAYNALDDSLKIKVADSFLDRTFVNGDEIKAAFDAAVAEVKAEGGDVVIVGGGAGGGGGGAGGGAPANNNRVWPETEMVPGITDPSTSEVPSVKFYDIDNVSWAKEAIVALAEKGIISGVTETKYNPNGLVTREQFAKLIVLASGKYDEKAVNDFTDIPAGNWSASYVASAKAAGFVNGIGNGKFGYGASIKREDMAVMIYNVMKALGTKFDTVKTDFADYDQISKYAKEAVGALTAKGIINGVGDNMFAPKSTATRAQAAVLVYAIIKGVA